MHWLELFIFVSCECLGAGMVINAALYSYICVTYAQACI